MNNRAGNLPILFVDCQLFSGNIPQQNRPILTTTGKRVPIRAESNAVYPARMPGECTRVVSRCGIP